MCSFRTSHCCQSSPLRVSSLLRACALVILLLVASSQPTVAQEKLLPVFRFQHLYGLTTDQIRSHVVRDHEGYIWVGTLNGLDRYDGQNVKEYRNDPSDPHSISSNIVKEVYVDKKGRLWVGTYDTGISLYDPLRDRFINFLPRRGDTSWYAAKHIYDISEDRSGNIWLAGTGDGVVRVEVPGEESEDLDTLARAVRITTYPLGTTIVGVLGLHERGDGTMLVASDSGLLVLNPFTRATSRLHLPGPVGRRLDSAPINCFLSDSHGNLWVGTQTEGLFRFDRRGGEPLNYRHKADDESSLTSDAVIDIAEDSTGKLWIGSGVGIDLFAPTEGRRIPFLMVGSTARWPVPWMRMSLDQKGVLWFGTLNGGVSYLTPKARRFPLYGLRGKAGSSPIPFMTVKRDVDGNFWFMSSTGILYEIDLTTEKVLERIDVFHGKIPSYGDNVAFIDRRGFYWHGTWGLGLFRVDLKNGKVKNYKFEIGRGDDVVISDIAQADGDSLWTAREADGLHKFDPASGRSFEVLGLGNTKVWSVMKRRDGTIWVGYETDGIAVLDPVNGTTVHLQHNPADSTSLGSDHVRTLFEDPSGRVWVGAGDIVDLWHPATRSFTHYYNQGFNKALFADILGADQKGQIWVNPTYGGLSVLDPSSGRFTNYDEADGVNGEFTMENLPDGRVVLSNWIGIVLFHPDSIYVRQSAPPLVITRMSINDELTTPPHVDGSSAALRLTHSQNVLELEFAALEIDAQRLVKYQYKLEGVETDWVTPKDRRSVRYPGLSPGDYLFRARATSVRGEWPDQEIALAINVAPPWWRSWWAYLAYGFFIVGLLTVAYQMRVKQLSLKHRADNLAELDRLKTRFFTNISHEFRTPLTLILGPVQKWRDRLEERSDDGELHSDLSMVERNAQRLLRLINQLLDFSKLEAGAMKLHARRMNIVPVVKGIAYSFESSAGMRRINLVVRAEPDEIEVYCDEEMLRKIVGNLVSNAFKFTPEGGSVTVALAEVRSQISDVRTQHSVQISVSDTGVGIPADQLDKVFDRFFQVDTSYTREHEGSGIGLALVRELVELHHGSVEVKSEVERGTELTVRLPLGRHHLKDEEIVETPAGAESIPIVMSTPHVKTRAYEPAEAEKPLSADAQKPLILVVEDNADVRAYIKGFLIASYQVAEAQDGAAGIEMAAESIPDLVISDVMMPKKDGFEVCKTLKLDERTSHVPVILLTAKAGSENKIEGLETGADDYLVKPFEAKELLARVKNLIDLRRKLRERFSVGEVLKPGEITVSSIDDAFLQKVKSIVETHISEEGFGSEDLSREVGMSRSQIHRKLTALTGMSAGDFIRYLRLHRAMDLLQQNAATVAEIAYKVGFGTPAHFTKSFHDLFGKTPSEVRKNDH
jgi:signal transduction histidine kinase/ligand-binding sensor domain-containing protein/CheY-like chemotaxis protein/AraC-like DNA-binding protein